MINCWKRVWAEIDIDSLIYNFTYIKNCTKKDAKICCVIKANAYGHYAPCVGRILECEGADWFAVSNIEEALQLRYSGIKLPILVLGYTPPECAELLSKNDITQCIYSLEYANTLSENALKSNCNIKTHIKIDTGMGRIGFRCNGEDAIYDVKSVYDLPNITVDGIFTHFAKSDSGLDDTQFTLSQYKSFIDTIEKLEALGCCFNIKHCANSAAIFDYPECHLDMVRAGIALYGLSPSEKCSERTSELLPVMTLKSIVTNVKSIEKGDTLSYGCDFVASRKTTVATVPLGYADGFWRSNGNGTQCLTVRGKKAPIIGRICMDQLMLDVTDVDGVRMGDEVVIFGRGENENTVDDIASTHKTINYEIVCAVANRVPRVFVKNGEVVDIHMGLIKNYVL